MAQHATASWTAGLCHVNERSPSDWICWGARCAPGLGARGARCAPCLVVGDWWLVVVFGSCLEGVVAYELASFAKLSKIRGADC